MTLLCRFFVVCLFALFAVRGASACESMPHRQTAGAHVMPMTSAPCVMAGDAGHGSHGGNCSHSGNCHASCCAAGCGHCGALPATLGFDMRMPGRAASGSLDVALRAGITHAPPLPPPIV